MSTSDAATRHLSTKIIQEHLSEIQKGGTQRARLALLENPCFTAGANKEKNL